MWHKYFVKNLDTSFKAVQSRNEAVSLRGYAKKVGVSGGMLSEILRGQRRISLVRALKIAEKAEFSAAVIRRMEELHRDSSRETSRLILKEQAYDLISNPLYHRVLCALEILRNEATVASLSSALETNIIELRKILKRLQKLEIVKIEGEKVIWNGQHVTAPDDFPSRKIRTFFRKNLKEAAEALNLPVQEREYTAVTFAGSMTHMPEAKDQIRAFREALSNSMNTDTSDQIFQLCIQLRPVSRPIRREEAL